MDCDLLQSISEDRDETIMMCHSPAFGQQSSAPGLLRQHRSLTPRMSLCDESHQAGSQEISLPSPKRKYSRFPIGSQFLTMSNYSWDVLFAFRRCLSMYFRYEVFEWMVAVVFVPVNWIKGEKNDKQPGWLLDQEDDTISMDRLPRRSSHLNQKSTPKLPHKPAAGHMSTSILRARKRVEDHLNKFGFGRSKNKHGSIEDSLGNLFHRPID